MERAAGRSPYRLGACGNSRGKGTTRTIRALATSGSREIDVLAVGSRPTMADSKAERDIPHKATQNPILRFERSSPKDSFTCCCSTLLASSTLSWTGSASIRKILVSLAPPSNAVESLKPTLPRILEAVPKPGAEPCSPKPPRKDVSVTRVTLRSTKVAAHREVPALANVIPLGPVVISAQALAEERAIRATAKAAAELRPESTPVLEVAPESLARDLSARWLNGSGLASSHM